MAVCVLGGLAACVHCLGMSLSCLTLCLTPACMCVSLIVCMCVSLTHSLAHCCHTGYDLAGSQLKASQSADMDEQMRFTMGRPLSELVNTVLPK